MSYVAIGFIQISVQVTTGTPITVTGDWSAAMLSLASAALGFLIGKQTTIPAGYQEPDTAVIVPVEAGDPCENCGKQFSMRPRGGESESLG
jgi:hypothetical protein